jgi:hypothetical protein
VDSGNQKIAARWFPPLTQLLGATPTPNFSLSVNPPALSVNVGTSQTATVTISRSGGFSAAVSLAASGVSAGVTTTFSPVSAAGTSTVTFTAATAATLGRADVIITGSGGGLTRTAPIALTVSPVGGGAGPATATPTVAASGPWFNEQQVRIATPVALTAMTLTITLQTTGGIGFNGQYNTVGSLVQSHGGTATTITYQWTLGAGQTLPAGTNWIFAAQSSGSGTTHPTTGDTYEMSYTAGGVNFTATGHF